MPSLIHVGHWSLASLLQPSVSHSLLASVLAMPSSAGGRRGGAAEEAAGQRGGSAAHARRRRRHVAQLRPINRNFPNGDL